VCMPTVTDEGVWQGHGPVSAMRTLAVDVLAVEGVLAVEVHQALRPARGAPASAPSDAAGGGI
jgi:hypothetical protein